MNVTKLHTDNSKCIVYLDPGVLRLTISILDYYKNKTNKQTNKKTNTPKQAKNPTTTFHGFFFLASFKVS